MHTRRFATLGSLFVLAMSAAAACSDDDGGGSDTTDTGAGGETSSGGSGGTTSTGGTQSTGGSSQGGSSQGGSSQGGSSQGGGGQGGGGPTGTCSQPTVLSDGDNVSGDTTGASDEHAGSCQSGSDAEAVYSLTASANGLYTLTLTSDADLGLYARTSCEEAGSQVACADAETGMAAEETLAIDAVSGETYYVFVDGYESGQAGAYTLAVSQPAVETMCSDSMDNNENGKFDCADLNCVGDSACTTDIANACGSTTTLTPGTQQSGDTTGGTTLFAGSCTGGDQAEENLYDYNPSQDTILGVVMASNTDQGLYARTACDDPTTELRCFDVFYSGNPGDEFLHLDLTGGQGYTLFVDGFTGGEAGPYTLTSAAHEKTETEGNDTYQNANTYAPGWAGFIDSGDDDWLAVTVGSAGSTLTATTTDVVSGDCASSRIDTEVEIYDTDGTSSLAFNDDIDEGNGNYCGSASASGLAAGTYYVRISASEMYCSSCEMGYTFDVTVE